MREFTIFTDSSCDLSATMAQELGLTVLPLSVNIDGTSYENDLAGKALPFDTCYALLRAGKPATTSAVNVSQFVEAMEPVLQAGQDILYLGFSSALSGTVASAGIAKAELLEKYPDRKIAVVDSLCASMGQGLYVYYAARLQKELDFDAMVAWLEENKLHFVHWFTVDDLVYLKRGGRVSGATAAIATVLQIKPVMHVDELGRLIAIDKVQGRKKSLKALVDHMVTSVDKEKADVVFIGHCDAYKDAELVAAQVRERVGIHNIVIDDIGIVIGAHSGPGTVALFFFGKRD